jgi:hypothetical protein
MKNIINENDDYLNLLYTKMSEKKRLDDINIWNQNTAYILMFYNGPIFNNDFFRK